MSVGVIRTKSEIAMRLIAAALQTPPNTEIVEGVSSGELVSIAASLVPNCPACNAPDWSGTDCNVCKTCRLLAKVSDIMSGVKSMPKTKESVDALLADLSGAFGVDLSSVQIGSEGVVIDTSGALGKKSESEKSRAVEDVIRKAMSQTKPAGENRALSQLADQAADILQALLQRTSTRYTLIMADAGWRPGQEGGNAVILGNMKKSWSVEVMKECIGHVCNASCEGDDPTANKPMSELS